MVSHNAPSAHDLELLSAYLDGELADRERITLEQRLTHDSTLRQTLDDLRTTVAMLHDLPRLKAPCNFTLDPAVYGRPIPWWRLFASELTLQFAGALGATASVCSWCWRCYGAASRTVTAKTLPVKPIMGRRQPAKVSP
ncbi:MAG: hypothetical protein K8S97_06755 [Anaerolineae bacterium]|nr:hypothetical protein [Anaerolineae bacterium]